jgi:choloylglycine hydrolase
MKKHSRLLALTLAATATLHAGLAEACSSFVLRNADKSFVYARTFEFGFSLEEQVALIPRNFNFKGVGPDGVEGTGLNWTGKYAILGTRIFGLPIVIDGINEKGLTGGMLYAPTTAVFQNPTGAEAKNSIASYQLINYILSNFATTDEVKQGLPKIFVSGPDLKVFKGVPRVHVTLHDLEGKSIVVEYLKGNLVITDNPVGAMTNDPPIAWHLNNVNSYVNLSPFNAPNRVFAGEKFGPQSLGSGLHGLPGDFSSPSRFIRAFFFSQYAQEYAKQVPKVEAAWNMIYMFDIPPGSVMADTKEQAEVKLKAGKDPEYDYTTNTVVADAQQLTYYSRPYGSLNIAKVEMKTQDLNAKEIKVWPVQKKTVYQEMK